ncbi:winged helix-turn-helix domain-containing protein [Sphingomonas radiodurans]|uniref:winged helix-turn-helix domain-containing protein n=1 Tax=Sphingomonas radiodurans TaxID=2890321 RepID=UPI001E36854D|nr:transcriptional regulator [Sphingomonas radiodurans]WBH15849.1 transcriptional regulator [Sphingomonas radiodurans]
MKNDDSLLFFANFVLDPRDRMLRRAGTPVELSARCLDALILLTDEAGQLVTKDRFMAQVWRGAPVTDEALTQCIKTLRRHLGDDAAAPHLIETVPRHGYRFIMPVTHGEEALPSALGLPAAAAPLSRWRDIFLIGGAGTLGAAVAGIAGGIAFGALGAGQANGDAGNGASIFLVLLWLTIVTATVGGAGVSFGIALAGLGRPPGWRIVGGAVGGLVVGSIVKVVGLDAFYLLLGRSPVDMAGGGEGMLLGGAVGAASWAMVRGSPVPFGRQLSLAALAGCAGGSAVALLGGNLMAGSFYALSRTFPTSHVGMAPLGSLLLDRSGGIVRVVTWGVEGALFAICIAGAMALYAHQQQRARSLVRHQTDPGRFDVDLVI